MSQAIETRTLDELAQLVFQLEYGGTVATVDDQWYQKLEILLEIDRRVRYGLVVKL